MSDTVAIDALPYYDRGYDEPGVREAAMQLVQEEMQRYRPTKDYLENLPSVDPDIFLSDLMKNEMTRIKDKKQMELLSTERYNLPAPTPGLRHDPDAWIQAVKNSQAQLQHQLVRIENLRLMEEYGSEAWLKFNDILNKLVTDAQNKLQSLRKEIQEVNWQRKDSQQRAGQKLNELEKSWATMVAKNFEIEEALLKIANDKALLKSGRHVEKQFNTGSASPKRFGF